MRLGKTILMFAVSALLTASAWARGEEISEIRTATKETPFETEYQFSRTVGAGRLVKSQEGKKGAVITTLEVKTVDGKEVSRKVLKTERVAPQPEIYLMGKSGYPTSRGSFKRHKVLTMNASAYQPMDGIPRGQRPLSKLGETCRYGIVAVDPRVIPLGTLVYVEGYGFARASDTGGAIKGNKIDLCMEKYSDMYKFGRRSVRVHILSGR